MTPKTITIVGLGLMGGSLAASCRRKFPQARITGISRNPKSLRFALKKKWIHEGTSQLAQGIAKAELVVLCSPVDTFGKLLSVINQNALSGTLVTDVGSVKGQILREIRKRKLRRLQFVGAHPMAGSHKQGIQAADPFLYDQGITFVIREKGIPPQAFAKVRNFWKRISGRIVTVSAAEHDQIVSEISHLPHALAVCLMQTVKTDYLSLTGSGFRDVTRIAEGDASIWEPILTGNQTAVRRALKAFRSQLDTLERFVAKKDKRNLHKYLLEAARKRKQI